MPLSAQNRRQLGLAAVGVDLPLDRSPTFPVAGRAPSTHRQLPGHV
jgi:hypothetical protein